MDAKRGAKKHEGTLSQPMDGRKNIADTWTTSRRSTSPTPHPWHQRHRSESTITLACNDEDLQAGPMKATRDFKTITKILTSLRQEKRSTEFLYSEEPESKRQRPFDETFASRIGVAESKLEA